MVRFTTILNASRLAASLLIIVAALPDSALAQQAASPDKASFNSQTAGALSEFQTNPGPQASPIPGVNRVPRTGLVPQSRGDNKLFGSVQRNAGLRIDRSRLEPDNGYQMDAAEFAQPPVLPQVQTTPLAGTAQKAEPEKKKANYVWNLSNAGGYYECTGQIKVVVPGDQLYKYGGTFIDGTAVPDTPVVTNFAGHAYRFPYVIKKQP